MTIRSRLILLLCGLLAVFGAALWRLQNGHQVEVAAIRTTVEQQRAELLDRLLELTGQSLHNFSKDYSLWGEMVEYVQTGDPQWAKINIAESLVNFGAKAAWVLRPDGSLVTRLGQLEPGTLEVLPFERPEFQSALRQQKMMHFFAESPGGMLEVRTAPIQPSDDTERLSPALGWFVVVRLWDEAHLQSLARTMQSRVTVGHPTLIATGPATIHLQRELPDWTGRRVRTLHVTDESLSLARQLEGNAEETSLLFIFGVTMITVTTWSLSRWVLTPLRQLGRSLESNRPETLQSLRQKRNEFGHLARLVEQAFEQRTALEREVRERTRLAEELHVTGNHLRESIELRSRLARDLHDGVIQTIYAAGLGLEGVRSTLRSDPAAAEKRLAGCQALLNDTIRDVRAFINDLESAETPVRPFRQTLATLVSTLQSIQPGDVAFTVDEPTARRLSPAQELLILQILREAISNALRHAAPGTIRFSLGAGPGHSAVVTVIDDGRGFDPSTLTGSGHGLVNLGIRARELGGDLQIESSPGKGTRLSLHFQPTYPP